MTFECRCSSKNSRAYDTFRWTPASNTTSASSSWTSKEIWSTVRLPPVRVILCILNLNTRQHVLCVEMLCSRCVPGPELRCPSSLWHGHDSCTTAEAQAESHHQCFSFGPRRWVRKHERYRASYRVPVLAQDAIGGGYCWAVWRHAELFTEPIENPFTSRVHQQHSGISWVFQ